jgi:hypothetical protein
MLRARDRGHHIRLMRHYWHNMCDSAGSNTTIKSKFLIYKWTTIVLSIQHIKNIPYLYRAGTYSHIIWKFTKGSPVHVAPACVRSRKDPTQSFPAFLKEAVSKT